MTDFSLLAPWRDLPETGFAFADLDESDTESEVDEEEYEEMVEAFYQELQREEEEDTAVITDWARIGVPVLAVMANLCLLLGVGKLQ